LSVANGKKMRYWCRISARKKMLKLQKKSCFMHIFADNPEIFGAKSNNKNGEKI